MVSSVEYVSVLFSEPKIPQSTRPSSALHLLSCFSALQRAENSSIPDGNAVGRDEDEVSVLFSEPKIPQWCGEKKTPRLLGGFSALQRAENSSMQIHNYRNHRRGTCFSALQRAENSSIGARGSRRRSVRKFQCSSASRKFLNCRLTRAATSARRVSVLFSEPKIPQCEAYVGGSSDYASFSALQRAENSSIYAAQPIHYPAQERFSALQRAENSSILPQCSKRYSLQPRVSVLFSEPKIPQSSVR